MPFNSGSFAVRLEILTKELILVTLPVVIVRVLFVFNLVFAATFMDRSLLVLKTILLADERSIILDAMFVLNVLVMFVLLLEFMLLFLLLSVRILSLVSAVIDMGGIDALISTFPL